jgi:hypothetical protein
MVRARRDGAEVEQVDRAIRFRDAHHVDRLVLVIALKRPHVCIVTHSSATVALSDLPMVLYFMPILLAFLVGLLSLVAEVLNTTRRCRRTLLGTHALCSHNSSTRCWRRERPSSLALVAGSFGFGFGKGGRVGVRVEERADVIFSWLLQPGWGPNSTKHSNLPLHTIYLRYI